MLDALDEISDASEAEPERFDAWLAIALAAGEAAEHGDLADDLAQGGRFRRWFLLRHEPRCVKLKQELEYFRRNRSRMDYARLRAQNLPIGSGVVEATCKTLVTQRKKRSGQRWTNDGGQAILTFRALAQSDRFDAAWQMVSAEYRPDVSFPENVVPINAYRVASV